MAKLSIHLERDEDTGELQLRVGLVSDDDATPAEHERRYRQLLARLLGGVPAVVERERPAREPVVG